jgi:hypothetical protein
MSNNDHLYTEIFDSDSDSDRNFKIIPILRVEDLDQTIEKLDQSETSAFAKRAANEAIHRLERQEIASDVFGIEGFGKDLALPTVGAVPSTRPDTSSGPSVADHKARITSIVELFMEQLKDRGINLNNKEALESLIDAVTSYCSSQVKAVRNQIRVAR